MVVSKNHANILSNLEHYQKGVTFHINPPGLATYRTFVSPTTDLRRAVVSY